MDSRCRWNLEDYTRAVNFTFEGIDPKLFQLLSGCGMDEQVFIAIAGEPSEDCPLYEVIKQDGGTNFYMITCNEGWRESIVCTDMYKHVADWLLTMLQGRPYPKSN